MSERSREVSVHKDMLRAQIKACESERQTLRYIHTCNVYSLYGTIVHGQLVEL